MEREERIARLGVVFRRVVEPVIGVKILPHSDIAINVAVSSQSWISEALRVSTSPVMKPEQRVESGNCNYTHMTSTESIHISTAYEHLTLFRRGST